MDVVDLRDFYSSPLGQRTRRFLAQVIHHHIEHGARDLRQVRLAGLGYATPYLSRYREEAERVVALMPARQGVVNWPHDAPNAAALVEDTMLPLPDSMVDLILAVHVLELADRPHEVLRESWRVLAPGGRLIVVVPNRLGVWTRLEHTPFGHGRPFSRGQLQRLMREALFSPADWSEALHFWPAQSRMVLRAAPVFERLGRSFNIPPGGVLVVEATKQLYEGLPARMTARERVFRPVFTPAASAMVKISPPS